VHLSVLLDTNNYTNYLQTKGNINSGDMIV